MPEEQLLQLIKADAVQGIEIAIEQYGGAVKSICKSILAGYPIQDVEEAISDAFVGLWKSRDKVLIKNGKGLKIYLYGIARKTALDKKRALAKQKPTEDFGQIPEMASTENIEEAVVKQSENEMLFGLIEDMKSPDREIFIYRYYEQNSIREIAETLSISVKSVEGRLARGRERLKKQLLQRGIKTA